MCCANQYSSCNKGYFTINKKTSTCDIIPSLHTHDYIEFCYFQQGSGTYTIDDCKFPIKNGDIVIINAQAKHSFSTSSDNLCIYNILFTPDFLDESLDNFNDFHLLSQSKYFSDFWSSAYKPSNVHIATFRHDEIDSIFSKLFLEHYQNLKGSTLLLKLYMIELITKILRLLMESDNINVQTRNVEAVSEIIDYMHEHYSEHITLESLAENVSYSKSHLCKIFKLATSQTVYEYLNELRITEACKLLHYTNRSLTDICMAVGFSDYKYFTKNFIQYTGKKPSAYRIFYSS